MDNNMPKIKFSDFLGAQLKEFRMQYKKKLLMLQNIWIKVLHTYKNLKKDKYNKKKKKN